MKCWGRNESYELGDGTTTTRTLPTSVVGLDGAIDDIELGETQSCARMAAGHTKCWGWNGDGRLGNGATNYTQTFPIDGAQ
jgi:alpha-tubulin suppressor-like RCC1 family protein